MGAARSSESALAWLPQLLGRKGGSTGQVSELGRQLLDDPRARGPAQMLEWIVVCLTPSDCHALLEAAEVAAAKHPLALAVTKACCDVRFLAAGFREKRDDDVESLLSLPFLADLELRTAVLAALHQVEASYGAEYLDEGGQRIQEDPGALQDVLYALLRRELGETHLFVRQLEEQRRAAVGVVARHAQISEHCFDAVWALCPVQVGGRDVALSGSGDNTTILYWDVESGRQLHTLEAHDDEMTCLTPDLVDPGRFWSGSEDGMVKLWDAATGACEGTFGPFSRDFGYVRALSCVMAPSGESVALVGLYNGQIHAVTPRAKPQLRSLCTLPSFVTSITLIEFGRANVAVGCGDKRVRIVHSMTGEVLQTLRGHLDGCFVMRSVHPPREVLEILGLGRGNPNSRLVSCSWDKTLRLWDLEDGSCVRSLRGHRARVLGCVMLNMNTVGDPLRQVIASCSIDGTVRFWDASTGECQASYTVGAKLFEIIVLPDGGLAVGTENGRVVTLDYRPPPSPSRQPAWPCPVFRQL